MDVALTASLLFCAPEISRSQTVVNSNVTQDQRWTMAGSPYQITAGIAVQTGVTLTVDPGVEIQISPGLTFYVDGRLMAEGTAMNRILITKTPAAAAWKQIILSGPVEHRLRYCDIRHGATSLSGLIRSSNTSLWLEDVSFSDTTSQLLDMQLTSITMTRCVFPGGITKELISYKNMPVSGHARFLGCQFGTSVPVTTGYNDIVDFVGNNRPRPIVEFIDNTFLAGVDDCFDMDGTDAHIEGNVFLHVRKDIAGASSSNAITTGAAGTNRSQLVVCRNWFYDVEHAQLLKDQGTALYQNNTIVHIRPNPLSTNTSAGGNEASGICMFGEPWRPVAYGGGLIFEGNIAADLQIADPWPLLSSSGAFLQVRRSLVQGFPQPGQGNLSSDPLFVDTSGITHMNIRQKLALLPASPCRGTGPNGIDMGAGVAAGATISGEPSWPTYSTNLALQVAGPGVWGYRWRLNAGVWSPEVSLVNAAIRAGADFSTNMFISAPINLFSLGDGPNTVEVQGRNSAGTWHDNITTSRTWTVVVDADQDLMGDIWEIANGLNPGNPSDAALDLDADGFSNLSEFAAGTLANDSASRLFASLSPGANDLMFSGVAGKSYQLQEASQPSGPWQMVSDIHSVGASGPVFVQIPSQESIQRRYYRIRLLTPLPIFVP
jgi:hypothetical protein